MEEYIEQDGIQLKRKSKLISSESIESNEYHDIGEFIERLRNSEIAGAMAIDFNPEYDFDGEVEGILIDSYKLYYETKEEAIARNIKAENEALLKEQKIKESELHKTRSILSVLVKKYPDYTLTELLTKIGEL